MENYIYIIIGIVWVIYSIYNTRQKALKKQQSRGLPPQGPSESSPIPGSGGKSLFDDILRELTGEVPLPKVNQPVKTSEVLSQTEKVPTNEQAKGSKTPPVFAENSLNSLRQVPENAPKTHPIYEQITKKGGLAKRFNLREAVIFSELLNRKYF